MWKEIEEILEKNIFRGRKKQEEILFERFRYLISSRFLIDFRAWKEIEEILERIFLKEEKNRERYSLRDFDI